jgi:hypothetical protein
VISKISSCLEVFGNNDNQVQYVNAVGDDDWLMI